jgi:hypothetical protein
MRSGKVCAEDRVLCSTYQASDRIRSNGRTNRDCGNSFAAYRGWLLGTQLAKRLMNLGDKAWKRREFSRIINNIRRHEVRRKIDEAVFVHVQGLAW